MASGLDILERRIGSVALLKLSGHLVADEGDRFFTERVTAIVAAGSVDVLVDLRNVTYIDSGGVGALVAMYLLVRRHGGHLKLLCPSARTRRVLGMTRLTNVFELFEREDEAVLSFAMPHGVFEGPAERLLAS